MTNSTKPLASRIDLTREDPIVATFVVNSADTALLSKIQFVNTSVSRIGRSVCVGLKKSRHQEIIDAFNRGLRKIKADGTYTRIFEKYGIFE